MKKVTLTAVILTVLMMCGNAQAQASTPKSKAGEYARHSAKYAEYIANCRRAATTSPKLEDEAAKKVDAMSPIEFAKHVMACQMNEKALAAKAQAAPKRVASKIPPAAYVGAGAVVGAVLASNVRRSHRGRGEDNYMEVREYLKNYKGPLWQTNGSVRNRFMNKQAPESAVPCKPPGYNHVVLCNPR